MDIDCTGSFSGAGELSECCHDILTHLDGARWALVTGNGCLVNALIDLGIWSFPPPEPVGERHLPELTAHWFVVPRQTVPDLQARLGPVDFRVLPVPVLGDSLPAHPSANRPQSLEPSSATVDTLRRERDHMLQVLIQANLKVQENAQMKNNFLARSVHDFCAPLTAINGYCVLLLEEEFGPLNPEQERVLQRMQHSATRLSHISNGMLQLSIPADVVPPANLEKADVRDCLARALQEVALVVEDKRISIATEMGLPPEGLLFEKSQIERVIANLLDNACRFTPGGGAIDIKGYPYFWERRSAPQTGSGWPGERRATQVYRHNSFRVDIRDSGPGIPVELVDRIFEEYTSYRGGKDRSGGGLGLAICRMILQRHQGRIWVEGSPSGAVFSFVLPVQPQTRGAERDLSQ